MRGAGEREKQVVKRNETRGSDHISADMRAVLLGKENAERAQSRLAAVCDVCGYGFYCPAAGTEMSGVVRGAADGTAELRGSEALRTAIAKRLQILILPKK